MRSTFLSKVVKMSWSSTKWWFLGKIVVGMTSFPVVRVSDFPSQSCSPTIWHRRMLEWLPVVCWNGSTDKRPCRVTKLGNCWGPTNLPNNRKGRCSEKYRLCMLVESFSCRQSSQILRMTSYWSLFIISFCFGFYLFRPLFINYGYFPLFIII